MCGPNPDLGGTREQESREHVASANCDVTFVASLCQPTGVRVTGAQTPGTGGRAGRTLLLTALLSTVKMVHSERVLLAPMTGKCIFPSQASCSGPSAAPSRALLTNTSGWHSSSTSCVSLPF